MNSTNASINLTFIQQSFVDFWSRLNQGIWILNALLVFGLFANVIAVLITWKDIAHEIFLPSIRLAILQLSIADFFSSAVLVANYITKSSVPMTVWQCIIFVNFSPV